VGLARLGGGDRAAVATVLLWLLLMWPLFNKGIRLTV